MNEPGVTSHELGLLGKFELRSPAGAATAIAGKKAQGLVALLALADIFALQDEIVSAVVARLSFNRDHAVEVLGRHIAESLAGIAPPAMAAA